MKECVFEKGANAMRLLDFQETDITTIGYDIKIYIERRIRIKIFDRDGFDAANITIPYVRRYKKSKINDVSAYVYNLDSNGNITTLKLRNDQIFKDKSKDGISTVSFTFPNIQPGSVIEYRYTHIEKNSLHIDPWYFQNKLPTALSVCKFSYPGGVMRFDYRFITTDEVIKDFTVKHSQSIRTFTQKNLPSFVPEPMMSSVKDNLQRVEFAFMPFRGGTQWPAYNEALLAAPFFGQQIETKIAGAEKILDSANQMSSYADKVHFIYQRVKSSLQWDGTLSFYSDDLSEVWKNGSANSAELNLSILNLLKKSGIKAYPILISTRDNGKPDMDFISLGQFNSVDVLISNDSNTFVLDGTQKNISYKIPPYSIINRNAFLIDSNISMWVYITDDRALMKTNIAVNASMNKEGEIKGDATILYFDHSKAIQLEEKKTKDNKKDIIENSLSEILGEVVEEGAEDELMPLKQKFEFTNKMTSTNTYYFLDPFILSNFRKNPFSGDVRRSDIDMGSSQSFNMYFHLVLDKDFSVDELPKNLYILSTDSGMLFKRELLLKDSILVIKNSFDIQRTTFPKEEYPMVRDYFKKIYGVISEPIILKKK